MAIFSGSYKIAAVAIAMAACLARHGLAADSAAVSQPTQPSTEVFDVKTKDLPSDVTPPDFKDLQDDKFINNLLGDDKKAAPTPNAAPAPAASTTNAEIKPAPAQPPVAPEAVMDSMLKGDATTQTPAKPVSEQVASPAPASSKTAAEQNLPTPPQFAPDIPVPGTVTPSTPAAPAIAAPVIPTPSDVVNAQKQGEAATPPVAPAPTPEGTTAVQNGPTPPAETPPNILDAPKTTAGQGADTLSESEKASYAELKKHLNNFVSGSKGQPSKEVAAKEAEGKDLPNVAVANEKPANPDVAANIATPEVTPTPNEPANPGSVPSTNVAAVPTADAKVTPAGTAPATPAAEAPAVVAEKTPDVAAKPKSNVPSDFDDFLEPAKNDNSKQAQPQPGKADVKNKVDVAQEAKPAATPVDVAKPVVPSEPAKATEVAKPVETKSPEQQVAALPSPKKIPTANGKNAPLVKDNIVPLPQHQPLEADLEVLDVPHPEEKEKLSEADKAYLKLLDKRRDMLPASKRLSDDTKNAIDAVSSELMPAKKGAKKEPKYIKVTHGKIGEPGIDEDGVIKSPSKMDISVRKSGSKNENEKSRVKLERAYKALLVGQVAAAISVYKEVLEKEPNNKDAMFGLATAYHKNSQFEQARTIYTDLLKKEPGNKEALNNFLVLVAEEAPEDALIELEKLERINSDFSPIAAQIAMISMRLGNHEKAARYLRRAILLSPDNVSYKYNLAVIYDRMGSDEQALQLYHQVIEAIRGGASVNSSADKLSQRITYLEAKISSKK